MKTTVETITPERARKYLQNNVANRPVRQAWVNRLAGMIRSGEWMLTHQGIAFAKDGRLIDGQHRLMAIVEAGMGAQLMVAREIDETAYRHIDGGAPRTFADRLKLCEDIKVNRTLNAILRVHLTIVSDAQQITVGKIEDQFLSMSDSYLAVAKVWQRRIPGITRSEVGAALASYLEAHPKDAAQFCEQLISGEGLYRGTPAFTLREGLISGRTGEGGSINETYYKAIGAMRAHHEKRMVAGLVAATKDFQGHEYTRLAHQRAARARKGAKKKAVTA